MYNEKMAVIILHFSAWQKTFVSGSFLSFLHIFQCKF